MFIDNVDIYAYLHRTRYAPGYRNWEISANLLPLRSQFKKMITRSDEIPYKNSIRNITREDLNLALDLFDAHVASKGKIPFEIKLRYLSRNGSIIYMLIKASVTRWHEDGEPLRMEGCNMDITNFVAHKNERFRQNEQYDMILEGINAGVWECDLEKKSSWWSDKFYELLGYAPGEMKASLDNFRKYLVHPDDVQKLDASLQSHTEKHTRCTLEIRLLHKDGNYYWFETTGKAKFDEEGKTVKMVGSIINRHHKKLLEAELEKNRRVLNETGNMTKTGGWEVRLNSNHPDWTQQVFDIYELSRDIQPSIEEAISYYAEDSRAAITQAFEKLMATGEAYDLELQLVSAKGNKKWVRTIGKPITDHEDRIVGAAGTLQDISEQKERELELRKINDINIAQNKRLSNFAHIVSHNLRTHAGNFSSLLSLLEVAISDEERKEIIAYLNKISSSLNNTISELNHAAQAGEISGGLKKDLRFETVFKTVHTLLNPLLKKADAQLDWDFADCPVIHYVPAYLESILQNLLSNAIKYRHPQRALQISVKTFEKKGSKFLSVTDNGSGIDLQQNHDQLFGMNKTFHNHPEAGGMGLYITKSQIESQGGNIYVCSTPGEGTTFTVQF